MMGKTAYFFGDLSSSAYHLLPFLREKTENQGGAGYTSVFHSDRSRSPVIVLIFSFRSLLGTPGTWTEVFFLLPQLYSNVVQSQATRSR